MSSEATPEPWRRPSLMVYLCVAGATEAIGWYRTVFGAEQVGDPFVVEDGRVGHAELRFGDTVVAVSDEWPEHGATGPRTVGGVASSLVLEVTDPDAVFASAIAHGATEERPVEDQFYGARSGWLHDPFGHRWNITATSDDAPFSATPAC